mmetsp:Transcript_6866/g.11784  ORF Transcript_6866/g.11784 Transcript_6866/m.11784 type:complete len:229 (-) Transcript_6866:488-1174(-)
MHVHLLGHLGAHDHLRSHTLRSHHLRIPRHLWIHLRIHSHCSHAWVGAHLQRLLWLHLHHRRHLHVVHHAHVAHVLGHHPGHGACLSWGVEEGHDLIVDRCVGRCRWGPRRRRSGRGDVGHPSIRRSHNWHRDRLWERLPSQGSLRSHWARRHGTTKGRGSCSGCAHDRHASEHGGGARVRQSRTKIKKVIERIRSFRRSFRLGGLLFLRLAVPIFTFFGFGFLPFLP